MRVLLFTVPRSRLSAATLLILCAALSGCGLSRTRGTERSDQLLSAVPSRSASCVAESFPPELPGVDTVVDSAMLAAAVAELLHQDPPPTGHVLLTLGFDREGMNIRRLVIEHSTTPQVADSIQRLIFAARRQVDEAEREWGVRLRVDLADPVRMRIGQREFCPPVARDRRVEEAMQGFHPAGARYRGGVRERTVYMQALVGENGIITSARIVRGELGGGTLERDLTEYLRQFLFTPATVDGVPTSAWVVIPVRVRG